MCRSAALTLLIALVTSGLFAQSDTAVVKTDWFVSLRTGALFQEVGDPAFVTASLMSGIRHNRLTVGVGAGYDVYQYWKLLPVFVGVGYDFIRHGANAGFLQVDGGFARAWHTEPDDFNADVRLDGGYFVHPAVGYRWRQGKIAIYFTVGYKFQNLHSEAKYRWSWGMNPTTYVDRDMQRLSVQMGIGLK